MGATPYLSADHQLWDGQAWQAPRRAPEQREQIVPVPVDSIQRPWWLPPEVPWTPPAVVAEPASGSAAPEVPLQPVLPAWHTPRRGASRVPLILTLTVCAMVMLGALVYSFVIPHS
ncbi:MAG TPA: hypothetical protein VG015_07045 [Candidatus Dormibacteraeota bacterium]|jgi:hypothetical protein|nr:hypothetical protein [Candidatus Dormibacteraeota bacterium]